jgi:hypothetical protein
MSSYRALIIANKRFEADPLMGVLANPESRPPSIVGLDCLAWPRGPQQTVGDVIMRPRASFLFGPNRTLLVEIWCIQDLMNPALSFSNTAEKVRVLPLIFSYGKPPDFVVAFGTAGFPDKETSQNGCAVLGGRVFVHNPYKDKPNPSSNWNDPRMDRIIVSDQGQQFLKNLQLNSQFRNAVDVRMVPIGRVPALTREVRIDPDFTAVSEVNIVDYHDYGKFDEESVELARASGGHPLASVETTHGVIRLMSESPFIFISGITDRLGQFDTEVTISADTAYAQNFSAAHNAALAAVWMIPEFMALSCG